MNQMNAGGMNPGVGGPVGGIPMMNNGSAAPRNDQNMNSNPELSINNLNTYIYDYFLKRGYHECARALLREDNMKINTDPGTKTSPGNRQNDMNGVDGDPMMTDGKDGEKIKIPDDLPRASIPNESMQTAFLLDWWSLFWEFFQAQRKRGNNHDVRQYLTHNQNLMRIREQQQNQLMRQQPMMPGQMPLNMRRNPMHQVPGNLQKTVLQNTSGLSQQQLAQQFQKNQQMQMMQMQRDQPDMDMNGNRPQSPASADNAPSPSKRPRLEGGPVNGQQLAPNGRGQGQGMQGQPNPQAQAMMMQNGINRGMNPAQFQHFQQGQAAQQKSMQGLPNGGIMNPGVMPNQTELVTMPDGNGGMYPMGPEYYQNGQMAQVRPGGMQTPNGQPGNHALQDYQMQLMLLEQQNKRRLMMARQEQDSMARDGQPMPGPGQLPPGTSPQGSRTGASPNPSEQMKRGTPKMPQSGLPGSPSAGDLGQNRGSPGSMNLNSGQMGPDMAAQFFSGGPGMRPPSSNPAFTGPQMGQPIPAGANRMPSGQWQPGQPMPPQHSPASQPQAGTPQERGAMPPPQAPPTGPNAGRAQPPSPQTAGNAPPTPQQANKPAPGKGKKEGAKENTRKRPKKGANAAANNAANASSTEAGETAQTPTPSTPVTPQHPNSFNKNGANAGANAQPQPTSAPAPQTMVQPTPDQNTQPFNDLAITDTSAFSLDFSALDNPDILESFDFDTFLNTDGDATGFGFDPNMSYGGDGVETATDGL